MAASAGLSCEPTIVPIAPDEIWDFVALVACGPAAKPGCYNHPAIFERSSIAHLWQLLLIEFLTFLTL
jgi:hypothetical protein